MNSPSRLLGTLLLFLLFATGHSEAQMRRRSPQSGQPNDPLAIQPPAQFRGVIKGVDGGKILLELPDGNVMEFRTTRKSKFKVNGKDAKLKDLASGQAAAIEGRWVLGAVEAITVTARPES